MSKVLVNETSLNGIASAIREKNGETTKYKPSEMAAAISALVIGGGGSGGEGDLPEELFNITGECSYLDYSGQWDKFFETFEGKIKITGITGSISMFEGSKLKKIPAIEGKTTACSSMFSECRNVQEIGTISNLKITKTDRMFHNCQLLRNLPDMSSVNFDTMNASTGGSNYHAAYMFNGCHSLRSIDPIFLSKINNNSSSYIYSQHSYTFSGCFSLDEINGVYPNNNTLTSNHFASTFNQCSRVKNITFATQDNGNPYIRSWKNQTISLYDNIGWTTLDKDIIGYNSGITIDKKVSMDAYNYDALKNDPDWYTGDVYFSRFNHTSAVNMINSLPDTSAYLATQGGGTNAIKFRQDAGSNTDGGGIGTLTEEEIAVATAKGWSISYAV